MNDRHDEQIDRMLKALGSAELDAGLEARVLARLEQNAESVRPPRRLRRPWFYGGLAFGTVCLLLIGTLLHSRQQPAMVGHAALQPLPSHSSVGPRNAPAALPPTRLANVPKKVDAATQLLAESLHAPAQPMPNRGLADLPSILAPPESATKQEQLLSRIAQGPKPEQFLLLNPAVQQLVAQRREAEFANFFPSATPQEIYLAEHKQN